MNKRMTAKGFTLVEVIVVLAILAVLAAILILSGTRYIEDARRAACDANVAADERMVQYALIQNKLAPSREKDILDYLKAHNCAIQCVDKKTNLDISVYEDSIIIFCPKHGKDDHAYIKTLINTMLSNQNAMDILKQYAEKNPGKSLDSISGNDEKTFIGKIMKEAGLTVDVNRETFKVLIDPKTQKPTTVYYIPDRSKGGYIQYDEFVKQGYTVPEISASGRLTGEERKNLFKAYYAYKYEIDPVTGRITTSRCFLETSASKGENSVIIADSKYIYTPK